MTLSICGQQHAAPASAAAAGRSDRLTGIALMTGSAASNQLGAATAALAFPALGPAGVVAVRQWVAGALLLAAARPRFASFTRAQWRPVLALALIFATMNLSLYAAVARLGLGLAVTLEFLGPPSTSGARCSPVPPWPSWPGLSRAPTTPASSSPCWPPPAGRGTSW